MKMEVTNMRMAQKVSATLLSLVAMTAYSGAQEAGGGANGGDSNSGQNVSETCSSAGDFCWGALTVPFKVELTKNQDVYGSASVGTYAGVVTDWWPGHKLTPIGFIGYSQNIPSNSGSSSDAFISFGLGALLPISVLPKSVAFGLVVGIDHTAETNKYVYNDKPWVSALLAINLN